MAKRKRKDFTSSFLRRVGRGEPIEKAMDEALIDSLNLSPFLDGLLREKKRKRREARHEHKDETA